MANVPVRSEMPTPNLYHHQEDNFNKNRDQYKMGEMFFKDHYMKHPMANVPVRSEMPTPNLYHHQEDNFNKNREQYMVGELFFKDHEEKDHDYVHFHDEEHEHEQLPYRVVEKYQTYEKRMYPSATFVCNKTSLDTAADPLAGLEKMNPYELMMTRRYQKAPRSQMFWELFKYIEGVNQNQEEIQMTSPVV